MDEAYIFGAGIALAFIAVLFIFLRPKKRKVAISEISNVSFFITQTK